MDNEKYYTPELWEFCEGFEFEYLRHDGSVKEKVGFDISLNRIQINLSEKNGRIRVKKLDREDIESCGYKFLADSSIQTIYQVFGGDDELTIHKSNGKIQIDQFFETVYYGHIHNLFHLKQILKDVGC